MTDKELINKKKYYTCGRCKHEHTPENEHPCVSCIYGTGYGADLWESKLQSKKETNGSIFLKTYPDSQFSSIAYDDGICYVYVYLGDSRTRFTSDWWNASYKAESEEKNESRNTKL